MNITSRDLVAGTHITHIYINQTPDSFNEKPSDLDAKLLVGVPIAYNQSDLSMIPNGISLYTDNVNDDKDAVVTILNDSNANTYKCSKSPELILENNETYSCHICINDNDTLNSACKTMTDNGNNIDCNGDANNLSENEYYCKYSITDIDELSNNVSDDYTKSQYNDNNYGYYSSGDSSTSDTGTDEIVTLRDKSNNNVRIDISSFVK